MGGITMKKLLLDLLLWLFVLCVVIMLWHSLFLWLFGHGSWYLLAADIVSVIFLWHCKRTYGW